MTARASGDHDDPEVDSYPHPSEADAEEIIEQAKEHGKIILFDRSAVYMRFTPYRNHREVKVHMWSCISMSLKKMPHRTFLSHPRIVDPARQDDYHVQMFTDEWVKGQILRSLIVSLRPVEDTPFNEGSFQWLDGETTTR